MSSPASKPNFDPVKFLSQAFSYIKHFRLMLICFAFAILAGIAYYLYATPVYQSKSIVYFQAFGSAMKNREVQETAANTSRLSRNLIGRLNSQQIKISAAQRMGLLGEMATYEDLLEVVPYMSVGIIDARHIEVTIQAYDPEVVRNYCGALVEEFQEFQEASWKEFRDEALERYAVQLEELEGKVRENVDSLSEIERDQKYTEVTIEQQNLLQIPKDIVVTREKLKRMDSIRETLKKYESDTPESENTLAILSLLSEFENESEVEVGNVVRRSLSGIRSTVSSNVGDVQVVQPSSVEGLEPWRELEREKRLLENEITKAAETFLPDHPKMQELNAKLSAAKGGLMLEKNVLREKFDLEYSRLTEKLIQLEKRIPEYQEVTDTLGKSSLEYNSIEQTQKMWDAAREKLSEKLATISFSEDFDWVQLRFKGHTSLRDDTPISPNKRKLVIFSLMLGIAGAIGIPTILNLLDTSAATIPQLEETVGLKGIGIVPLADQQFLEAVHRSPAQGATVPNYLLECFRIIRANIGLESMLSDSKKSQVILVTSSRPQEGKTTLSSNLAWAFHSMGEKVLLVDCDLRRGRVHGVMQLNNSQGMSTMLTGDISPEQAIADTEQPNFHAIPRGPIIPGATELLCQKGFYDLVQKWRKDYDRIILDCPPVLGLSESTSLQRLSDGVAFVVRSETTSTKDVKDAVTILRKTGAHFFGFILNCVDLSKVGNYYQYYYYSAPYYDQFDTDDEETGNIGESGHSPRATLETEKAPGKINSGNHDVESKPVSSAQEIDESTSDVDIWEELSTSPDQQNFEPGETSQEIGSWVESPEEKEWINPVEKKP